MKPCYGCFEKYEDELDICPHCGHEDGEGPEEPLHLCTRQDAEGYIHHRKGAGLWWIRCHLSWLEYCVGAESRDQGIPA